MMVNICDCNTQRRGGPLNNTISIIDNDNPLSGSQHKYVKSLGDADTSHPSSYTYTGHIREKGAQLCQYRPLSLIYCLPGTTRVRHHVPSSLLHVPSEPHPYASSSVPQSNLHTAAFPLAATSPLTQNEHAPVKCCASKTSVDILFTSTSPLTTPSSPPLLYRYFLLVLTQVINHASQAHPTSPKGDAQIIVAVFESLGPIGAY
jgi:hypothetical protein